jgi:hypothetical protein
MQILVKENPSLGGGTRWQTFDGRITIETTQSLESVALRLLFESRTRPRPTVWINHAVLESDRFVIAGETPTHKFVQVVAAAPDAIRGLNIAYDKALEGYFGPTVVAIADSFDPGPNAIPVMIGGGANTPACSTTAVVSIAGPRRKNLLTVRRGPGLSYREVDRLPNGVQVAICDQTPAWLAIIYSPDQDIGTCRTDLPSPGRQPYAGPCPSGWIPSDAIAERLTYPTSRPEPLLRAEEATGALEVTKAGGPSTSPALTPGVEGATPQPVPLVPAVVPKECPTRSSEFSGRLALIKARVSVAQERVEAWRSLRKAAEEAQQRDMGRFCETYRARMQQALDAIVPFLQRKDEEALLDRFNACLEPQLSKLEKAVDEGQGRTEPVGLLLKLHADLIRIKIETGHLLQGIRDRHGTVTSIKGAFAASARQCSL